MGYERQPVAHSKIYVSGDVHTNTIEGFWFLLKLGIGGVYHAVSTKPLQAYWDECAFRYNNRDAGERGMSGAMLNRVEKTPSEPQQLALPEGPLAEQSS